MDKLLEILRADARMPLEDIAAMTGLTMEQAADKIDEYKKNGILKGFTAVIDREKADAMQVTALIELRVTPMKNYGFDAIAEQIVSFREVESVYLMSGGYDLGVTLHAKTFRDVALFVSERLASLEGVLSTTTHFVLRRYKDAGISFIENETDERSDFGR